jgi:hypothetical protein
MKLITDMILLFVICSLFFTYVADSAIINKENIYDNHNFNKTSSILNSAYSQIWEDDFLDESKIDSQISYNYEINKTQGIIYMKDTYEAWYNPDFTRMKKIDVFNSGVQTLNDYVIDLIIYYDSDMQNDFEDLRFTDEKGNNLHYWIGETINSEQTNTLVRINEIPPGHTEIYMFYGNPSAQDDSDFDMIFIWDDRTDPDVMVSYKNYLEGAWDSDVEFGDNRFLVAWEERLGPEDLPDNLERAIFSSIKARSYNENGGDPNPDGDADIEITPSGSTDYHAQNPSIAYGNINNNFLVVWEENPATIFERFEIDIKAALVTSNGDITNSFTVCDAPSLQADPCVAYDVSSNRFFIVWEDARDSTSNYDVYGRIYNSNGNPITNDFQVASGSNCQDEPWVCSDGNGNFMVVYEDGLNPEFGPFDLKAQRFDSNGNKVGSIIDIAFSTSSIDHIFPSVIYCEETERYCIVWNDADLSSGQYRGNIWGKILDKYGNIIYDNFIVQSGYQYIRSDIIAYLDSMFFISYDGSSDLWGKLISSNGEVQTNEHMLSDGSSQSVDWNNLAVGNGKIMAVWEDERDQSSEYADSFGSVWHIYHSTGSSEISYNFGDEILIITEAAVISDIISPYNFEEWGEFHADYITPIGTIEFDILNEQGNQILMDNINPGRDISSINQDTIRLRATYIRSNPEDTPVLDLWSVSYAGSDQEPPWTNYEINPENPDGENGWYTLSVECIFEAHDDVSQSEDITTYYKINEGIQRIYENNNRPKISSERHDNKIEFWSVDGAGNEEFPHNIIENIKIDKTKPTVTIEKPDWGIVQSGNTEVLASVYESNSGSGIEKVEIFFNGGKAAEFPEQNSYYWSFDSENWQQYDIEVRAYDKAGNNGNAYVSIRCSKSFVLKNNNLINNINEFLLYFLRINQL